ncbi:hypothetical protein Fmac_000686 [Flemingia macrophylla]|uniref:Uncharacterized protein n=1 Tax=Flemingia macrophylla TaxID=520843 RepID=A0ABD1NF31_9FABA
MTETPSRFTEIMGALEYCDCEDMGITYCSCFRVLYAPHKEEDGNWLGKKLKKVMKVLLESLVWPKKDTSCLRKKRRMLFQYDPKSYALNFDVGVDQSETHAVFLHFSARYASRLGINK